MALPDAFAPDVIADLQSRLERLGPETQRQWGKMDVAQMMAHCCTPYLQLRGEVGGGPWLLRFMARHLFKGRVVGEAPFSRNIPTPKAFSVTDPRDFHRERERLRGLIQEWHGKGDTHFEGREHVAFGALTAREWSNLFYKHLDHHFRQFGV